MGSLESALKFPFADPGWKPKLVFGGVLNLIAAALGFVPYIGVLFWVIFSFLPLGYAYKILSEQLQGKEGILPAWEGWEDLFKRGFFVFLVVFGYWVLPGVLYWIGMNLWYGSGFSAFIGVFFLILGFAIGLVAFFLLPMALAFYIQKGEHLTTAFQWKGIVEKIWLVQREYFIAWVASLVLFAALLFLRTQVPFLGWILFAFGSFYVSLVIANLFGKICREEEHPT
jgi:hypothetical protein